MKIEIYKLKWKEKHGTPKVESIPHIIITTEDQWFNIISFGTEDFWEQYLWLKYFNSKEKYPWYESDKTTNSWRKYWILEVYNYLKYEIWKR